ncbi:IucA/IucC family siderophore biosynthesis protein [Paenibacillus sp. 598K]|uniref:IucA/IucC family protein n=1 Tax=Paenibacillus sp. 598K TaxID=1117987 RepID=UPI000FF9F7E1|nr:IucA/IucC family protein [Paenibacillus sp. 598K]GBF76061.1 IucA/IucC family siderophore biosynthesis protein [Paenibacillus sp. 598K]
MSNKQAIAIKLEVHPQENQQHENSPAQMARREMLSRMLNAYLRESGQHAPWAWEGSVHLPGITLAIQLPATGQMIYGTLLHRSAAGHHVYGNQLYASAIEHLSPADWRPLSFEQVTALLLEEIAAAQSLPAGEADELVLAEIAAVPSQPARKGDKLTSRSPSSPAAALIDQQKTALEQMVYNSLSHMTSYLAHAIETGPPRALSFRYAEQTLLCGHPFHPTPKSLEGFSAPDSRAYSPEYGVGFDLSCFAAAPELVAEDWLGGADSEGSAPWVPAEMTEAAHRMLVEERRHYKLLPCHPWQADYLRGLDDVQRLMRQGLLIDLGRTGPRVYPTSSVRTVWNPREDCFYKLSLHIRITNFIRENTEEQLLRTLDASRIIAAVKDRWESASFQILLEQGYRTLQAPGVDSATRAQLMAGFSMIVREAPDGCNSAGKSADGCSLDEEAPDGYSSTGESPGGYSSSGQVPDDWRSSGDAPYVVASLMEVLPGEAEPLLFRAVRESLRERFGQEADEGKMDWLAWFRQYVEVSMVPILRGYATYGISLEAHVQNAMLRLSDGMPDACYVRDLEGISVDRSLAEEQGWVGSLVQRDSPVLYDEEEARHRLKYYFFVNHLSHVVQRLAYYTSQSEQPFWRIVRETLTELREQSEATDRLRSVADDLLHSPTLPAKANLLSRFHQRGETPLYVDIPNPIRIG